MNGAWWLSSSGKDTMHKLPEWLILDLLYRHPAARRDYLDALARLENEDDRERLQDLWDSHQGMIKRPMVDPQEVNDALQARHNKAGVWTRKPRKRSQKK